MSDNRVVKYEFDYVGSLSEGLMEVRKDGKYGYVDATGNLIIDYQFDWADDFSEGLATVRIDDKWGYIANPLVYQSWSPDELGRETQLGLVPAGYDEAAISVDEFAEILESAFGMADGSLSGLSYAADSSPNLTKKTAAMFVAYVAQQKDANYCGYFLPDCEDAMEISDGNKFQTGYAIQTGIMKLEDHRFDEGSTVSRDEAYRIVLRMYEHFL